MMKMLKRLKRKRRKRPAGVVEAVTSNSVVHAEKITTEGQGSSPAPFCFRAFLQFYQYFAAGKRFASI